MTRVSGVLGQKMGYDTHFPHNLSIELLMAFSSNFNQTQSAFSNFSL